MFQVQLLDDKKLQIQLQNLERRVHTGAKDSVDHPAGLHDDVANAVAGVAVAVAKDISIKVTPEEMEGRLPRMGKREERMTFKKAVKDAEAEFAEGIQGKKILKPGDLGFIHRVPRKEKRELFPEIDSKTYRRKDKNN